MVRIQTDDVHPRYWRSAHQLAAELSQWGVDANLLRTAAAYLQANPGADFDAWLERLARLGDLFSSSEQTGRYRHLLRVGCQRVRPQPASGREWVWVLSWAARLYDYYKGNRRLARQVSDVAGVPLPRQPDAYQPPRQERPAGAEEEIPGAPEEVSEEAEDLFAQMQEIWASREEGE